MASEETALEKASALLGEHFINYAIVVQYDDESVWHEGNNALVEKALYQEALTMITQERQAEEEDIEVVWDDEDDEADEGFRLE